MSNCYIRKNFSYKNTIPEKVKNTICFFQENNLWFRVSKNFTTALTCIDASKKRKKNGKFGIPLHEELKSLLFTYYNNTSDSSYVLLHCPANLKFSWRKIKDILKTKHLLQSSIKDLEKFNFTVGTVNPFILNNKIKNVLHLFDTTCYHSQINLKKSMMTNAGDSNWGIEFNPNELINLFLNHSSNCTLLNEITKPNIFI